MKKFIIGSALLLVTLGGVIYMAQGEELKASDERTTSESRQVAMETTETSALQEADSRSSEELQKEEAPNTTDEHVEEVERQPVSESTVNEENVTDVSNSDDTSTSESATEPSYTTNTSESITSSSSSTSTNESTVDSSSSTDISESTTESSSSTSSSESATKPSSSTIIDESTTEPSIDTSTTKPSNNKVTNESSMKENTSKKEENQAGPMAVPSNSQPTILTYPSHPSVTTDYSPLPTIGNTSPLGEHEVLLDEALKVSQVAESDLNGYELPLLSSFADENQGILVYEGLRHLGEEETNGSMEALLSTMYLQLFNQEFTALKSQTITRSEELQPGDTLFVKNVPIGMYLGGDHYLTVKKMDLGEGTEAEERSTIALLSERKTSPPLVGKRATHLKKTAYGEKIVAMYPANIKLTVSEQTQDFIDQIGKDAQKLGLKYDVFASVMIAQAILESGSGSSGLSSAPNYNLFGVKGSYEGQTVQLSTQEDNGSGDLYTISAAFRKYPSYAESLGDYVTLIREGISGDSKYYQEAWRSESKNYLRAAQSLTGKYATDTSYHHKISSIISAYHLTQYDEKLPEKGTKTSVVLQDKKSIPESYRVKMTFPNYDGKNYNLSGSYPVGQCTWYAYNRVTQLGGHVDEYMGNGGEWGTRGRALGYEVTHTPKPGYLVSFSPGTAGSDSRYGHVAFVEAVTEEGILISEGNVVGGTTISYRVIPNDLAKSNLVSYIKPQ